MPWKVSSPMSQRLEFVTLASAEGANLRRLCRHFSVSPTTAYKWIARFSRQGAAGLSDHARRPHHSPTRTRAHLEQLVLDLRARHPAWGGRKLRRRLLDLGHAQVPSASTITDVLRRHGLIDPAASARHTPVRRFEHAAPNDLWQMDFKGEFATGQGLCYPLTVLDDHSRFSLGLRACPSVRTASTRTELEAIFRRYGLPVRMTMDNGAPWGIVSGERTHYTRLTVWLLRLGIRVSHSRPHHPQTQGKDERFHRTLGEEVLKRQAFGTRAQCQRAFDAWREVYNCQRPHEALGLGVPAARYVPSWRAFPESLPAIVYPSSDQVRKVQSRGQIKYHTRRYFIGNAFEGLPVGLRPTTQDGVLEVYFCQQRVACLDLRAVGSPA
jgi:transposase InsO family protein